MILMEDARNENIQGQLQGENICGELIVPLQKIP
jgi:hypothetical protein